MNDKLVQQLNMVKYLIEQNNLEIAQKALRDAFIIYLKGGLDEKASSKDDFNILYTNFIEKYKPKGLYKECLHHLKTNDIEYLEKNYDELVFFAYHAYKILKYPPKYNYIPSAETTINLKEDYARSREEMAKIFARDIAPQKEKNNMPNQNIFVNNEKRISLNTTKDMYSKVEEAFKNEINLLSLKVFKYKVFDNDIETTYNNPSIFLTKYNWVTSSAFLKTVILLLIIALTIFTDPTPAKNSSFGFLFNNYFWGGIGRILYSIANFGLLLVKLIAAPAYSLFNDAAFRILFFAIGYYLLIIMVPRLVNNYNMKVNNTNKIINYFGNYKKFINKLPRYISWVEYIPEFVSVPFLWIDLVLNKITFGLFKRDKNNDEMIYFVSIPIFACFAMYMMNLPVKYILLLITIIEIFILASIFSKK